MKAKQTWNLLSPPDDTHKFFVVQITQDVDHLLRVSANAFGLLVLVVLAHQVDSAVADAKFLGLERRQYVKHFDVFERLRWLGRRVRYLELIWLHVGIATIFLTPPTNTIQANALLQHPHQQALPEATSLAGLATTLVDLTVIVCRARVLDVA